MIIARIYGGRWAFQLPSSQLRWLSDDMFARHHCCTLKSRVQHSLYFDPLLPSPFLDLEMDHQHRPTETGKLKDNRPDVGQELGVKSIIKFAYWTYHADWMIDCPICQLTGWQSARTATNRCFISTKILQTVQIAAARILFKTKTKQNWSYHTNLSLTSVASYSCHIRLYGASEDLQSCK